jgi:hypothetical protein
MSNKVEKKTLIKDLQKIAEKFLKENPESNSYCTRVFYLKNTEYGAKYRTYFDTFADFKRESIGGKDKEKEFSLEKKILKLEEENLILKKDKDNLLKNSINEDYILQVYVDNLHSQPKYPIHKDTKISKSDKVLILNLSDLHLGEVVIPEHVNYVNDFDKNVCIERLNILFHMLIKYAKKIVVSDLHLILNGDLLAGGIHPELVRNSDLNEVESLLFLQKYLTQKISELTKYFNQIYVDVVVGNHSRLLPGRPYYKEKVQMNYEYLLGKQLEIYFDTVQKDYKEKKVYIHVPESAFMVKKVKNLKFLVTHGDVLCGAGTGGFAGIPFYSIAMSSAKLYGVLHQLDISDEVQFDHILAGHLHTTTKIPLFNGGFCFINGCVIGTNEFSLIKMKSIAKREQLLLVIDENGIDGEINIRV